jgi:hypothetical protein
MSKPATRILDHAVHHSADGKLRFHALGILWSEPYAIYYYYGAISWSQQVRRCTHTRHQEANNSGWITTPLARFSDTDRHWSRRQHIRHCKNGAYRAVYTPRRTPWMDADGKIHLCRGYGEVVLLAGPEEHELFVGVTGRRRLWLLKAED